GGLEAHRPSRRLAPPRSRLLPLPDRPPNRHRHCARPGTRPPQTRPRPDHRRLHAGGGFSVSILVVGSAAFDDIETPFGKAEHVLGGSAIYFAAAASLFTTVNLVSVVGRDMPA